MDHRMTNQWLKTAGLKPKRKGFVTRTAALDQAIKTNYYGSEILKDGTDPMCRICGQFQETIDYISAGCPEVTKTKYLHWNICRRDEYKHKREMVRALAPNSNRKREHHNLVGYANPDRLWDEGQQARYCNQEQTGKKMPAHWYVHPHWKEHFS